MQVLNWRRNLILFWDGAYYSRGCCSTNTVRIVSRPECPFGFKKNYPTLIVCDKKSHLSVVRN